MENSEKPFKFVAKIKRATRNFYISIPKDLREVFELGELVDVELRRRKKHGS